MVSLEFGALEGPAKECASIWHAREKCPILAQRFLEHRFFGAVHTQQGYADLHNIYRCQPFTFTLGCLCVYEVYLFLGNLELPVMLSKIRPFPSLSLRPILCSFDTSLSSFIPDINWRSHELQYSRLPLCCLTHPLQAVTYSLRKNSFNSHEVYLQVFVVTSLTLVIVESRARGFRVLHYQRWRNGKLPKLCLLPATLA